MLNENTRQTIRALHARNTPLREISRLLKLSRNSVRRVLRAPPTRNDPPPRKWDDITSTLPELFSLTQGNAVRMQELLHEQGIEIPYSTLTYWIRQQTLRQPVRRSGSYAPEPGQEFQHDTSPHKITLGQKTLTAQCAGAVLAFSRMAFMQYYPQFTRFEARVFLTEAVTFFEGACPECIIDNTSVLVASGSGPDALIAPEMKAFGAFFGMRFVPHALGHPDRKAVVERLFSYVEKNFLAARQFSDWEDLNVQARQWCQQTANQKVKRALNSTPQAVYHEVEKPRLRPLPAYVPPVYQTFHRVVDSKGFVNLETQRYSVPERLLGKTVTVLKYADRVDISFDRKVVASHPRLLGDKNQISKLDGHHPCLQTRHHRSQPSVYETSLRGTDPRLDRYVTQLKRHAPGKGGARLRRLLTLQRSYPSEAFFNAIELAGQYGLYDLQRLEKLILDNVAGSFFNLDEWGD